MNSVKWKPIESVPYDQSVLLFDVTSGAIYHGFCYDESPVSMKARGVTHWAEEVAGPALSEPEFFRLIEDCRDAQLLIEKKL